MTFTLPYPPTANRYWRHPVIASTVRHIISKEGRLYRHAAATALTAQGIADRGWTGPLSITIHMYPPDRRRRDLDNIWKQVLDAMGHAGVYEDDSQMVEQHGYKHEPQKPGRLEIEISAARSIP